MRGAVLVMGVVGLCAGGARAQSGLLGVLGQGGAYGYGQGQGGYSPNGYGQGGYGQGGYDPCRRAAPTGGSSGAFGALASMLTEPQRSRECTELRRSQWAEYAAKQKAAKDKTDADAASARKVAEDADAAKVAAAAAAASVHEAAVERRATAAAASRRQRSAARAEEAQARRVSEDEAMRGQRAAALARRTAYVRMVAAENAPDNMCRQPKVARAVMDGWNGLDAFHDAGVKVIDIEHFTTVGWHAGDQGFACHGVFVTNKGWRVVGTTVMKRNVAGDPMFVWQRDERQDLATYQAPAMEAGSPEVESGVKVGVGVPGVTEAVAKGADGRM